jgi:hypothetical protein
MARRVVQPQVRQRRLALLLQLPGLREMVLQEAQQMLLPPAQILQLG